MKKLLILFSLLIFSFTGFTQSRYISETTKKVVYARDGGKCQCCGSTLNLEYDHVVPYSCGGKSDVSNVQLLCQKCNRSKSNGCYCKVHDKKVGYNCCDGKSKKSQATSKQCTGTTKSGTRCRNKTTSAGGRCHLHD